MPIMTIFLLILPLLSFAGKIEGVLLIKQGKSVEGYRELEQSFQVEIDKEEKARIAYLLAFAPAEGTEASPVYYARFALKYHQNINKSDSLKLKMRIADSFMEFGEHERAFSIYQELLKDKSSDHDYVNYQLGYYYLNQGNVAKSFGLWQMLINSNSQLKSHALRSLGRYWERLKFPGTIGNLSKEKDFLSGFAVAVDEREKELTISDLDQFVAKKSTVQMLTMLIEKNTLFVKKPCDFVMWYETGLDLANNVIFPLLSKCNSLDKKYLEKNTLIAERTAQSENEKLYLISLLDRQGLDIKACSIASQGKILREVLIHCQENSTEIKEAIVLILASKEIDKEQLKTSKVIRSSVAIPEKDQKEFIKLVGEDLFAIHFFSSVENFQRLVKKDLFLERTILKYALSKRNDSEALKAVSKSVKSIEAKKLFQYISEGRPFDGNVCSLKEDVFIKIALESKILSSTLESSDLVCGAKFIEKESALMLLSMEKIIERSEKVRPSESFDVNNNLLSKAELGSLPSLNKISNWSKNWGQEISLLLKVQNFRVHNTHNEVELLNELKKLKSIRVQIVKRNWLAKVVLNKTTAHYNKALLDFISKNESLIRKLKLQAQIDSFVQELRFS